MRRIAWLLLLSLPLVPDRADACGGLFCDSAPVVQTGEGIIFAVDREAGTVQALINIRYQGPASEFAWLLPLQSAPTEVGVAPSAVFNIVEVRTRPVFQVDSREEGSCDDDGDGSVCGSGTVLSSVSCSAPAPPTRITEAAVGPYQSAVIESSDPEDARRWLVDNGYVVTDAMFELVTPYVAQGDALLALRLQKDKDTGDIQPISITMSGSEVCIPLRLTAIAALDDMEVTALVLSDEGRAIPENYYHVVLNRLRVDWIGGGSNYESLVALAADEASGNAFVTEYAGSTSVFQSAFYSEDRYLRSMLEATATLFEFLDAVRGLFQFPEVVAIVARHLPDSAFAGEITRELFIRVGGIIGLPMDSPFDPGPAIEEIWERVIEPLRSVQEMFDRHRYATRLYTRISAHEMTVDPTFIFDPSLPDVSNFHTAVQVRDCSGLKDQRRLEISDTGEIIHLRDDRDVLDSMPAALSIEQLAERRLIADNSAVISELLDRHNAGGCDCSAAHRSGDAGPWSIALLALLLLRRRVAKRVRLW